MDAVTVHDLHFAYPGNVQVLDGIDFTIKEGETVVLAGLSGSGKTTLTNIICGVIPQLIRGTISGQVQLFGEDVIVKTPAELTGKVALVFQDSDEQLICTTVEDELAFGPENLCVDPAEIAAMIDTALERYHLSDFRHSDPARLSGGQKKMVALASVSMLNPRLIIFDEPLSGLDDNGRTLVAELLMELKTTGQTVIIVEHDLTAVTAGIADRWLVLADGHIAAFDKPQQLLASRLLYDLELMFDD